MNSPAIPPQPEPPSPGLTIRLLGDFSLWYRGEPIPTVNTPRLQALLAYLLLHRQAPQSRRRLAFLFWPDSTEAQALTNLRKQILYLRQVLPDSDTLLHMDRQSVRWAATTSLQLDVDTFRAALAEATTATNSHAIPALRQALAIYGGELLPGCYDDWLLQLREALHAQRNQALEQICNLLEEQRNYAEAIGYAQQLLQDDSLHEATYRRLIRLYALNGDRAAALRLYHTCVTQLREELGIDPDEETQAVYERLLQGTAETLTQPELAAYAPFVGRQAEWQLLQQRWRDALRKQPQFVLLAGEAGIGKTRLAEELLNWASHQGFNTVQSRCYAAEGRLPYAPIIEWLRAEPLRQRRGKVAATWLTELARLLPEILTEQPTVPPPAPITQSWQRNHLFEAVTRTLLGTSQPLLLLLDDLQWCDKETLELLHFLLRNASVISQSPLLLVGTARLPDEVDATHPLTELLNALHSTDTLTQLYLARLTTTETGELARQMVERTVDERTLQQLFSDTAGNPLFVVETLRAMRGQIVLNETLDHLVVAKSAPLAESKPLIQQLPPKVLAVIQARLGQLSPLARELCEWAAIVGHAFTVELLTSASKIDQNKTIHALDELWQRRIIREQSNDTYDFSHDRIRDVATANISRIRRAYLHRCVAEALEGQRTESFEQLAAQLAAHYEAAGMIEKAIAYYKQAAHYTSQIYANHETVAYLQHALDLLKQLPAGPVRDQNELTSLHTIAPALAALTGFTSQQLGQVYERAYALSQQLGLPPNPALLRILAIHKVGIGTFDQVHSMGLHLLALTKQQQSGVDPVVYVEGCYVLGINAFWQGQFTEAKAYLQQGLNVYSPQYHEKHITAYGLDPGPYCRARLGLTLWYLGFPDQARQQCEVAFALARELNHPFTLYLVLAFTCWLHCDCRNIIVAQDYLQLFSSYMDALSVQVGNIHQFLEAWNLVQQGEGQLGIDKILDYIVWRRKSKTDSLYGAHAFAILVEAYRLTGDLKQGVAALEEGFALLHGSQTYWFVAELYRLKGELLLAQDEQSAEAQAAFQQAIEIAQAQQAKSLELRATMSLARLWQQQGKTTEAYALLAEVYGWFTEGFDTPDLQDAKALLAQLQRSTA